MRVELMCAHNTYRCVAVSLKYMRIRYKNQITDKIQVKVLLVRSVEVTFVVQGGA